jgi:serine/threonine protein kinase
MQQNIFINYQKGTITKFAPNKDLPPSYMALEIKMTERAREIGEIHHYFRVPKIINYDIQLGYIEFEYIPQIQPLKFLLHDKKEIITLIKDVGKCLAFIHNQLILEKDDIFPLPQEIDMPNELHNSAFIHGDFNLDNVQFDKTTNQLVILDWSLSPYWGQTANWGSVYWDILKMIGSIIAGPPHSILPERTFRETVADFFLKNYLSHSLYEFNITKFSIYSTKVRRVDQMKIKKQVKWFRYVRKNLYWYYVIRYITKLSRMENIMGGIL